MNLTRNEKRTLKLLLENAKISDSAIATTLKVSSQAVGKIRRKLERTVIDSYTTNLNYEKMGIHTFAIGLAGLTSEGAEHSTKEIEDKLLEETHIVQVHRVPASDTKYIILYGFQDVNEMDAFFHTNTKKEELHNLIKNHQLFTFSHTSVLKNSPIKLLNKIIENSNGSYEKHQKSKILGF